MSPKRFVLSTVGTSLFVNFLKELKEDTAWLTRTANDNDEKLDPELRQKLDELKDRILQQLKLSAHDRDRHRRLSAELNGLYGIYGDQLPLGCDDLHWLVVTDTAQGRKAGEVLGTFLHNHFSSVQTLCPAKLSTRNTADFDSGIKELIGWCEANIPKYKDDGYEILFNLVGGFKSLHGYLSVIGMFYADEIAYIFEASDELIRIPRLPITINIEEMRDCAVGLALLASEVAPYPNRLLDCWPVPNAFREEVDDHAILSTWGKLVWGKARRSLLATDLLEFPRLKYTDQFQKRFKEADPSKRIEVQERIARVAALLEINDGNTAVLKTDNELQYDNYVNKKASDGSPIGHFRLNNRGDRVSCVVGRGTLVLRKFGAHDEVNDKP